MASASEDIQALNQRVLADLDSVYDYYTNTKIAWKLVHRLIKAGETFTIQNRTTGTTTTERQLLSKVRGYLAEQLVEATFQQFFSIFESFFVDLLGCWLTAYPQSLGNKTVEFKSILESPNKEAVTQLVVRKEVDEVLYKRLKDWFDYLEKKARLGCPSEAEIARLAEAKASRDVLVHNRGITNEIYLSKAGALARFAQGERIDIPEHYHRETWELIRKVVADVTNAAILKASS